MPSSENPPADPTRTVLHAEAHLPPDPPPVPPPKIYGSLYVLSRPDDFVLLGVQFLGFAPGPAAAAGGAATVVAGNEGGELLVVFPSQAATEVRVPPLRELPDDAWLGLGWTPSSRVEFAVPAGTTVPLTADGVLGALRTLAVVPSPPGSVAHTELELPPGLKSTPVPRNATDPVQARHPVASRQQGDATALWQTELTAASGLLLRPTSDVLVGGGMPSGGGSRSGDTSDFDVTPLNYLQTQEIFALTRPAADGSENLPRLGRLRLSALGATFTVAGDWPTASWQHDLALGRDRRVRFLQRCVLLPFGHPANLVEVAERLVINTIHADGTETGRTAVLLRTTLYVDAVRTFPDDGSPAARAFPFDRVEVLTPTIEGVDAPGTNAVPPRPLTRQGVPIDVPVRLHAGVTAFDTTVQMVLREDLPLTPHLAAPTVHPLDAPGIGVPLVAPVSVPAVRIDLVRSANPLAADVQELRELTFVTNPDSAMAAVDGLALRPAVVALKADLPALRAVLPPGADTVVRAVLSPDLIAQGASAQGAVLKQLALADAPPDATSLLVDLTTDPQRAGALISPKFVVDTVGRTVGPIAGDLLKSVTGLPAAPDLTTLFSGSKLLGIDLVGLLPLPADLTVPQIVEDVRTAEQLAQGVLPTVTMSWTGLKPRSLQAFVSHDATLDVTATLSPTTSSVGCTLSNFALALPPGDARPWLTLTFAALTFTAVKGTPPVLKAHGVSASFDGELELLKKLEDAVDLGDAGQIVTITATGIRASYAVTVPEISPGLFTLRNIDFRSAVDVPFTGDPVSATVSFASRDNPFTLTVLAFGGGGYLDLEVDGTDVRRFEASLDFEAQLAVDFGVAAGEIHALGGATFTLVEKQVQIDGFLRLGGSVQVLGIVTVSLELRVDLHYADRTLTGSATLVIDVDVTIWSDSVEIDSGTWTLAGGDDTHRDLRALDAGPDQLAAWRTYRKAFSA